MNIHEHQAKDLLRKFGAFVPKGVVIYNKQEISKKIKSLRMNQFVIKAQIHAGGRGKAGGIKLVKNKKDLIQEAKNMFGKKLVTHQTGSKGKVVKRIYVEEVFEIKKEFYLACLVDRSSSKIAFISSTEGGVDIEKIAKEKPNKIITTKFDLSDEISNDNYNKIIKIFNFNKKQKDQAKKIIKAIFNLFTKKDASLIEINPLIIKRSEDLCCLDAKINFDDNSLFRHTELLELRDLNEEVYHIINSMVQLGVWLMAQVWQWLQWISLNYMERNQQIF